jgi:hypothetical protein
VDLYKAISELHQEKKRLDRMIAGLEATLAKKKTASKAKIGPKRGAKRRGRKSMSEEERKQVSARMARYWASKRAGRSGDDEEEQAKAATS